MLASGAAAQTSANTDLDIGITNPGSNKTVAATDSSAGKRA